MTITPRLKDALTAASRASALQAADERPVAAAASANMAPLSLTLQALPRSMHGAQSTVLPHGGKQATVPPARLELFARNREQLLEQVHRRDPGKLPPSWAGISGRLSQEEAASEAAELKLIVAQVMP